MKFKNMKKGRVIEHKESGAIAIVLNDLDDAAELLFQTPDLNPHDTGCATYALSSWEAEQYRLIKRPVVGVVYTDGDKLVAACDFVHSDTVYQDYSNNIFDYSPDSTLAVGFI